jgi:dihydrofolate reductase
MTTFIIAVLSADGFIARSETDTSTSWTSKEDFQWYTKRTKQARVLVMGRKTFDTFRKIMPGRQIIIYTQGEVIVPGTDQVAPTLDKNSQIDLDQKKGGVWTTQLPPAELLEVLDQNGADEVAISGGGSIYTQFLTSGLVDTLYLTIEPIIFGDGIRLFDKALESSPKLELKELHHLSDQTKLLEYKILKSNSSQSKNNS